MYQGAPLPHEMKSSNDNWVYNTKLIMQSFSEIDTTSKHASKAAGFAWEVLKQVNMRNLEMFGLQG